MYYTERDRWGRSPDSGSDHLAGMVRCLPGAEVIVGSNPTGPTPSNDQLAYSPNVAFQRSFATCFRLASGCMMAPADHFV